MTRRLPMTKRLMFRLALPVVSAVVIAAVLIAVLASFALDRFDEERQHTRLTRLSQRAYGFCESAYDELARSGGQRGDREARIARVRVMATLEDFFRSTGLEGLIDDGREVVPLSRGMSDELRGILSEQQQAGGAITRISADGTSYFVTTDSFDPWGWKIVIASNARDFRQLIRSMSTYYILGFALVTVMLIAIFAALNSFIKRPIDEVVGAVRKGEVPQYRGIAEFEYLSDQLRDTMRKRDALLANIEKSCYLYAYDTRGNMTQVSPAATKFTGYTGEEFLRDQKTFLTQNPVNLLALEHSGQTLRGIQQPPYEIEIYHKDGSILWVEVSEVPLRDANGAVIGAEGICRDITGRKKAETELRESRQLLASLMGSLPGMAYRCRFDNDWSMEYVSEGCLALTGYRSGDLIGNLTVSFGALIHPEDRGIVRRLRQVSVEQGQRYRLTYRIFTATGDLKWVWEQGQAMTAGDAVQSLVGFITDITETKKLEDELLKAHKLESLGVLAGGIAHDFNNLLQAILGNISLARLYQNAPDKLRERLVEAERATREASELGNRLLACSKGGAPVRSRCSLLAPLGEAVRSLSQDPKVQIDLNADGDLPAVDIDDRQLSQVFRNLLQNAREAMPGGGAVRITVRSAVVADADGLPLSRGAYVVAAVRDEGSGILPENLGRVFDPYYTTKDIGAVRGRGLGLTVCHSIVHRHGGLITAASPPGGGAVFTVYIPALPAPPVEEPSEQEKGRPERL